MQKKLDDALYIVLFIILIAVASLGSFFIGRYIYQNGYKNGYNNSLYTARVTHVQLNGDEYNVYIRDNDDKLYIHHCSVDR
jgi:hypothetical protein